MRLALHWQVLIGLAIGVLYAWLSIQFGWNEFTIDYIKPFGDIFINVLKLIAVPLVLFSIISGVSSLGDPAKLGRLGIKTVITYLLTTMTAVVVGLLLVNLFQPGARVSEDLLESNRIDPLRALAGRQRHRGPGRHQPAHRTSARIQGRRDHRRVRPNE